jgi:hypothetical protein
VKLENKDGSCKRNQDNPFCKNSTKVIGEQKTASFFLKSSYGAARTKAAGFGANKSGKNSNERERMTQTFHRDFPKKMNQTLSCLRSKSRNFGYCARVVRENSEFDKPKTSWTDSTARIIDATGEIITQAYHQKLLDEAIGGNVISSEKPKKSEPKPPSFMEIPANIPIFGLPPKMSFQNQKLGQILWPSGPGVIETVNRTKLREFAMSYNLDAMMDGKGLYDPKERVPDFIKARMKDFNEYYQIVLTKGWNDLTLDFDYDPTLKEFLSHRSSGRFWGTKHPVPLIEITEQVRTKKDSDEETCTNQ